MNSTRMLLGACVVALIGSVAEVKVAADEGKRNPFRDGTGQAGPETDSPRRKEAEQARFDKKVRQFEAEMAQSNLRLTAAVLEGTIQRLQFDLDARRIDAGPNKGPSDAIRFEARLRAEEVMQQVRRDAAVSGLREVVAREVKWRAEVKRLKALPEKPADGSLRKALEERDDARLAVEAAQADLVQLEIEHAEEVREMRQSFERTRRSANDPDAKTKQEIEAARAALGAVNVRLFNMKHKIDEPVTVQNEKILKELQELRREVSELRQQKK